MYGIRSIAGLGLILILTSASPHILHAQSPVSTSDLVRQFEGETVFWRQLETAKTIVASRNTRILPALEPWLSHADRHLRGNAAFIFAALGDPRGFDALVAILNDRSENRTIHRMASNGAPSVQGQISEDRYYAAHLLGDLKDARAIPILLPLMQDPDVKDIVPWSLGQIGNASAIAPLIQQLSDPDPNMRVLAIYALVDLKAKEALPRLRQLLDDHAKCNFDKLESVAEAAQTAITKLR